MGNMGCIGGRRIERGRILGSRKGSLGNSAGCTNSHIRVDRIGIKWLSCRFGRVEYTVCKTLTEN